MKKASKIILINSKKEILFHLRDNKSTISFPNQWELIGGGIEKNESPLSALRREVMEEIEVEPKNIIYVGKYNFKKIYINKKWISDNWEIFVFKGDIDLPLGKIKLNEGQKLGYFNFEEILHLKIPKPSKDFLIENKQDIFN